MAKHKPYVCEIVENDIGDDDIKSKVAEGYEYLGDIDTNRQLFRKMWEEKKRKLYDCKIVPTSDTQENERKTREFVEDGYEFVCKINPGLGGGRLLFRKRTEEEK
jgi:hypothetical protein